MLFSIICMHQPVIRWHTLLFLKPMTKTNFLDHNYTSTHICLRLRFPREDETATHFLLRLVPSLVPIGTVRCVLPKGKDSDTYSYKLGRLVVLAPYRKYRLGRALVLALHEWATQHAVSAGRAGAIRLIAHSQLPVKAFYAK